MARRQLTNEEKDNLIKEFQTSNDTKIQFCTKHQISVTAFHSWIKKKKEDNIEFIEVPHSIKPIRRNEMILPTPPTIQIEISGIKLSLPLEISPQFLGQLIKEVANV